MTDTKTKKIVDTVYGKENKAKVLKNNADQANTKREFLKKYPDADISKFEFRVILMDKGDIDKYETYFKLSGIDSFNITSDSFKINKQWTKYLTSNKDREFGIWYPNGTVQTYERNTTKINVSKFKAYVTDDEWFEVSLTPFDTKNTTSDDYESNPYLTAILAVYVSTYICGISSDHLEYKSGAPGIITS